MISIYSFSNSLPYFVSIAIIFVFYYFLKKPKHYPSGPIRWPIVGNALSIGSEMHLAFQRYARKYGSIFSVQIASEQAVVLHGAQLIKEAFNHPSIMGRPLLEAGLFLSGGINGLALGYGKAWGEQRRFIVRNLRHFGFGKNSLETLILNEVTELVAWIKKQNGQPVALHRRLSLAVVNTLWTVLSGERYAQDDPTISQILDQLETIARSLYSGKGKSLLIFFYPEIAKWFPNWSGWNYLLTLAANRQKIFEDAVRRHQLTLPDGPPRDFMDAYLQEVERTKDPASIFHKSNAGAKGLVSVVTDLFNAGADPTTITLDWAILFLLHYPHIQTKIKNEIDRIVGKSKLTSLADRPSMPHTEAFILEVLRITSIVSYGIPHCVTEDVELRGYMIPKGVSVYASLYSTHHDPEVWGDPESFRPDRFLSPDGSKVEKYESLIPFSTGKRQCPAELLARDQLFLFIATLVQNFRICNEVGKPMPTLNIVAGKITLEPHRYSVIMKERL